MEKAHIRDITEKQEYHGQLYIIRKIGKTFESVATNRTPESKNKDMWLT